MSPCYTHYFVCIAPQWSWDDDVFFSAGLLIIVTTIFPQFSLIDGIQKIQREGSLHNTERTAKFFWQKESLKQWKQRAHLWLCFWKQTSLKTFFGEWRNQDVFFFQDRPPTYHSLTSTLRLSFWCQTLYFEFMRHLQTQTMQSRLRNSTYTTCLARQSKLKTFPISQKNHSVWKSCQIIIKKIARESLIDDSVTNSARYLHAIAIKGENHCCIK